jgi:hypothetical protein
MSEAMPEGDRARLVEVRRRSKTGGTLSREETDFVVRMFELYPDEYSEVEVEIREWANRLMNPLAGEDA